MEISPEQEMMLKISSFNLFPPSIRSDVISSSEFRKNNGLTSDVEIKLGGGDVSFKRSDLFSIVRSAYADCNNTFLAKSIEENNWSVIAEKNEGKDIIRLTRGEKSYLIDVFWPLDTCLEKRLNRFEQVSKQCGFSVQSHNYWHQVLSQETVRDDDVNDLGKDISMSPNTLYEEIKSEMLLGRSDISLLVPSVEYYYERLVGEHCGSENIYEYTQTEIRNLLNNITSLGTTESLLRVFAISSHSSIPLCIKDNDFDISEFKEACEYLVNYGDPFSCVAAIELGFLILPQNHELEGCLEQLTQKILDEDFVQVIELQVSLIKLIDGELARLQLFNDKPPFYRRLASIGQASLVTRCAIEVNIDFVSFSKWAEPQREIIFYCRTFLDLRSEPKWYPSYLTTEQLQSELLSRIYNASQLNSSSIMTINFKELLLGEGKDTVAGRITMHSFLPGPLEGNTESFDIPPNVSKVIDRALAEGVPTPEALSILLNSTHFWKIDPKFTELALNVLTDAKYQLKETKNKDDIFYTLNGLAKLACVTNNTDLANSLSILTRKYRDYLDVKTNPEQILMIGVVAAASFDDIEEWAKYVGNWINELAFLPLESEAGIRLLEWVRLLCVFESLLYTTTGKALAALDSFTK